MGWLEKNLNLDKWTEILFDTDKIDIARRTEIENPDGTTGETGIETPIYTNVYCHISFDNIETYPIATKGKSILYNAMRRAIFSSESI